MLLIGATALTVFWVFYYRDGVAWREKPMQQFNLHPILMVAGFITLSGFCKYIRVKISAEIEFRFVTKKKKKMILILFSYVAILLYRLCRCLKHLYAKLAHTLFHTLAIPCVAIGFLAVWDYHNLSDPPIPNFYTLHSWLGLVTMGLFALQFVFGFFT